MIKRIRHALVLFVWRVLNRFELWRAKKVVLPAGVMVKSDLPYHVDGSGRRMLDVYYPETETKLMPVIIYIHGGGFVAGDKLTEKFPPAFISSGEVDGLHPESLELIKTLESRQIFHKALLFKKKEKHAFHVFQQHLNLHTAKLNMEKVAEFLNIIS